MCVSKRTSTSGKRLHGHAVRRRRRRGDRASPAGEPLSLAHYALLHGLPVVHEVLLRLDRRGSSARSYANSLAEEVVDRPTFSFAAISSAFASSRARSSRSRFGSSRSMASLSSVRPSLRSAMYPWWKTNHVS